jgi:hypothetical protein
MSIEKTSQLISLNFGLSLMQLKLIRISKRRIDVTVTKTITSNTTKCSFCGTGKKDVKLLIEGPAEHNGGKCPYICNECIVLAKDMLDDGDENDHSS